MPSATAASSSTVTDFDWGSDYYKKHGVMMPADGADQLRSFDAIFSARSAHRTCPTTSRSGACGCAICQPLDQYANVRPTRILPGITSPLRDVAGPEISTGSSCARTRKASIRASADASHRGLPDEVATEVAIFTRAGVTRIIRFAFKLAQSRPRKLLTVVTKSNAQRHGMVMWDEIAAEVAKEFPDVTWDKMLVDAMTMRMVLQARRRSTRSSRRTSTPTSCPISRPRSRARLGIAPTANINPERDGSLDVRADPRLGLRHHRQGHREPGRNLLDRGA